MYTMQNNCRCGAVGDMENKIRIRFELTDLNGYNYISESTTEVFPDMGETELTVIGEQLNTFLKQCSYTRKNDYIFMEDITEEEYDALTDYLHELRKD